MPAAMESAREQGDHEIGGNYSYSDSSGVVSDPETESDFVPPSSLSSSPLPLTCSEEQKVDQCTRIGLVATHKCSSDILTEEDRREMAAIRKSLGMLPRKSQTAARTRPRGRERVCPQSSEERDREEGDTYHLERGNAVDGGIDQWTGSTSESSSGTDEQCDWGEITAQSRGALTGELSVRSSGNDNKWQVKSAPRHSAGYTPELTRVAPASNRVQRHRVYKVVSSIKCRQIKRQTYSNGVPMRRTRPGLCGGCIQTSCTASNGWLVCAVCRNHWQPQWPTRKGCFGAEFHNSAAVYQDSHSLMQKRAPVTVSVHAHVQKCPELCELQHTIPHWSDFPRLRPHPPQSQGSYFQQFMRKKERLKPASWGPSLPSPPLPTLLSPAMNIFSRTYYAQIPDRPPQRGVLVHRDNPPHRGALIPGRCPPRGVAYRGLCPPRASAVPTGYANMHYAQSHKRT